MEKMMSKYPCTCTQFTNQSIYSSHEVCWGLFPNSITFAPPSLKTATLTNSLFLFCWTRDYVFYHRLSLMVFLLLPRAKGGNFPCGPHWVECHQSYCLFTILLRALYFGEFKFKCVCMSPIRLPTLVPSLSLSTLSPCLENWEKVHWSSANALILAGKWASLGFARLSRFLFALRC